VTILDNATLIGNATMPEGSTPCALAYDPQNDYVYVANFWNDTVAAISGTTTVATIAVGEVPDSVFYNPPAREIYVTYNDPDENMSAISGTSLVGNVTLGQGPISPVYDPSNHEVYVADSRSSEVSVLAYAAAESTSASSSSSSSSLSSSSSYSSSSMTGLAVVLVTVAAAVGALYTEVEKIPELITRDERLENHPVSCLRGHLPFCFAFKQNELGESSAVSTNKDQALMYSQDYPTSVVVGLMTTGGSGAPTTNEPVYIVWQ
jgi:hypothetical protein